MMEVKFVVDNSNLRSGILYGGMSMTLINHDKLGFSQDISSSHLEQFLHSVRGLQQSGKGY